MKIIKINDNLTNNDFCFWRMTMTLGSVIKNNRNNIGLSISELAERVGCSHGAIWNWEKGQSYPPFDKLVELEKILGLGVINKSFMKGLFRKENCEKVCE